jgi:hypothetical protein
MFSTIAVLFSVIFDHSVEISAHIRCQWGYQAGHSSMRYCTNTLAKIIGRKVHALTNRPLSHSSSLWPADERLNLVSSIGLLKGSQDDLETSLGKIEVIREVTHVYYHYNFRRQFSPLKPIPFFRLERSLL